MSKRVEGQKTLHSPAPRRWYRRTVDHSSADLFVRMVNDFDPEEITELSTEERLKAIVIINESVLARFPETKKTGPYPIDEDQIPDEINALCRLTHSIQFSPRYQNLMMCITQDALDRLLEDVSPLRDYLLAPDQKRKGYLQAQHAMLMDCARDQFSDDAKFARRLHDTRIKLKPKPRFVNPVSGLTSITYGYADIGMHRYPGSRVIGVNNHEHTERFQDVEFALGLVFHETMHCLEGQISYLEFNYPRLTPEWLKPDAQLICLAERCGSYISPRTHTPYTKQFNEVIAHRVGYYVQDKIGEALYPVAQTQASQLIIGR